MASRAVGAMLALVAAVLLLASLASPVVTTSVPAWFDGHPIVDGKERVIQDVHVGPFGAAGCNERGCSTIRDLDSQFQIVWYVEGGLIGLGALLALILAIGTWRLSDRRKAVGVVSLIVAILCAAGAAVLLWQGPHLKTSQAIEIPIGGGVFLVGGGVIAMGIAAIASLVSRPQPLRLKPSHPRIVAGKALREAREGVPAVPEVTVPSHAPTPAPREAIRPIAKIAEIATALAFDASRDDPQPGRSPAPEPVRPKAASLAPSAPPVRSTPFPTDSPANHPLPPMKSALPGLPPTRATPNPPAKSTAEPHGDQPSAIPPTEPPTRATPYPGKSITTPPANASSTPPGEPSARPTPIPRGKGPSVPPPARAAGSVTSEPPLRRSSPTIEPSRTSAPTIEPAARKPAPTIEPPRKSAPTIEPSPPRKANPTIEPSARKANPTIETPRKANPTIDPPIRRSNPTLSSTVPPPPEHPRSNEILESDSSDLAPLQGPRTSVEIDAAGKAAAKAAEAKRHDAQAARVAAEEEARRRNADNVRIAEAKRREAEARAADNEAIAKRRAAGLLPGGPAEPSADAEIGEREADSPLAAAPLTDDDLSTPRQEPSHEESRSENTGQLWGAAPPRVDAVKLAIKRAPSATPAEGVPVDGKRATTDVIEPPQARSIPHLPISTASSSLPPPKASTEPSSGPTPACPQCEAPMAWVEEHLRFYCKQCRMYF